MARPPDQILSQIQGQNKHQHYRGKSQKYSDENPRIWEGIRHGFIYGSQEFVKAIKDRYMVGEPDPAIPQQKSIIKDSDPLEFSTKASKILQGATSVNWLAIRKQPSLAVWA